MRVREFKYHRSRVRGVKLGLRAGKVRSPGARLRVVRAPVGDQGKGKRVTVRVRVWGRI